MNGVAGNQQSNNDDLRILYQVSLDDIRYFKTGQWRVIYHGFLLLAAIAGFYRLIQSHSSSMHIVWRYLFAAMPVIVIAVAFSVLRQLETAIEMCRIRVDQATKSFSKDFRSALAKADNVVARGSKRYYRQVVYYLFVLLIVLGGSLLMWYSINMFFPKNALATVSGTFTKTTQQANYGGFWKEFFPDASATLVGVFLALSIDRLITWRRKKTRRRDLLKLLQENLRHNRDLLLQVQKEFKDKGASWIPTYDMDVFPLDSTASIKYEVINDMSVNRCLDNIRYELTHLNRKFNLLLEIRDAESNKRNTLVSSIVEHIPEILKSINGSISQVDAKLR